MEVKKETLRVIVVPWLASVETQSGEERTLSALGAIVWNYPQLSPFHWEAQVNRRSIDLMR
jgi:hypothetical protein